MTTTDRHPDCTCTEPPHNPGDCTCTCLGCTCTCDVRCETVGPEKDNYTRCRCGCPYHDWDTDRP